MKTSQALKIAEKIADMPYAQQLKEIYALAMSVEANIGDEILEDLKRA